MLLTVILVESITNDSGNSCHQEEEDFLRSGRRENETHKKTVEDFRILKIATHNINRIKGNSVKLEMLID